MIIVLAGFMAAGKTTTGRILAAKTGFKFYDSDKEIEKQSGMSVENIFAQKGEDYFRKLEKEIILNLLDKEEDFVMSVGGGAVLDKTLRDKLINSTEIFCLDLTAEEVLKRTADRSEKRPLLKNIDLPGDINDLMKKRERSYQELPVHINTKKYSAEEVAEIIIKKLKIEKVEIHLSEKKNSYPVLISSDFSFNSFNTILKKIKDRKVFLAADIKVINLHGEKILEQFNRSASSVSEFFLKGGEHVKDLKNLEKAYNILYDNNFSRSDYVIVFGGGTIGDLGALIASTYLRGLKLIQLPTTIISQLDSSVGGKTAVNFRNTKNLIGTFYQPEMVYYSLKWLSTLEDRDRRSGTGEIIKYALLAGGEFYQLVKANREELLDLDDDFMLKISKKALKLKNHFVSEDIKDQGLRRMLNLGHTFGHAVEAAENFEMSHGEAVAVGLAFTAYISTREAELSQKEFEDIIELISYFNFKLFPSKDIEVEELADYLTHDKKIVDSRQPWILLNGIGNPFVTFDIGQEKIKKYMEEYLCRKWQ
ncbi:MULTISPECIES: 3-dehydroquinate synthase [unclassified Halanaerobium]|uniref:3-dehydroquinate synthase n=1 Tax=unclassified Halanaerobium TaxID=2641197 RepID=UPI000DF23475|nr:MULTISPECIES: 3-dehydroquinate synthase [unclassified Halanaerobium]RCW50533.1 3-dehydroquinate synthase [Halanaerobium sp. MA284_MarDTE_T2]RCW86016.1 3-dehydroquinate synthase [Halanaerobium sp. DL-01]